MRKPISAQIICFLVSFISLQSIAQQAPRIGQQPGEGWQFGIGSGGSFGIRSNENSLFRGNGISSRVFGYYYFEHAGIGFSNGFIPGSISNDAINNFISERKYQPDQIQVAKNNPFNSYFLLGPSLRFGKRVMLVAQAQAGFFLNHSGGLTINQNGLSRPLYRFDGGDKNIYPGFSGSLHIAYPINRSTQFFFHTDYLQSKSSIRLYDPQSGIDVATEQSRKLQLMTAGIGIIKSFSSSRETGSGLSTGRRSREAGSGLATGRRVLPTVNKREINAVEPGTTGNPLAPGCGTVTQTITNPDGSMEQLNFACAGDAANYNNLMRSANGQMPSRISTNVTVPKQTQGTSFGEKVMMGLPKQGIIHRDLAARNIISGTVTWTNGNSPAYAIVTNNKNRGSSINMNSQTSSTRLAVVDPIQGLNVAITAREAGSGIATGKRNRESGSGLATGRRQHQPVFVSGEGTVCSPCLAEVKENPLYQDKINGANNPQYGGQKLSDDKGGLCGQTGHFIAILSDANTGEQVATTKFEPCGDFWFANVPDGDYLIRIQGELTIEKYYDVSIPGNKPVDLAGVVSMPAEWLGLVLFSAGSDQPQQKAGISTSRSNIRSHAKSIIIIDPTTGADVAGTVMVEMSDGSTRDVTADASISKTSSGLKKVVVRGWDPVKKELIIGPVNAGAGQLEIIIGDLNGDGRAGINAGTGTVVKTSVIQHPDLVQYNIVLEDDGADLVWSPRSNVSSFRVAVGDLDGDGLADMVAGNGYESGQLLNAGKAIPGISIKAGKKAGGNAMAAATNENGEFEFANLEPGEYSFTIEQKVFVDDAMPISSGEELLNRKGDVKITASQNSQSLRQVSTDTKSIAEIAPKKEAGPIRWTAPESMKRGINTSRSNIKNMLAALDDLDDQLDTDASSERSIINTSRSNIKNQRLALYDLRETLANMEYLDKAEGIEIINQKTAAVDMQFQALQESLAAMGKQYSTVSNVLKSRHETAMASIRNIK